ncbi:MAG: serine/threonine-protein kinase [Homoserinimonas sp.]
MTTSLSPEEVAAAFECETALFLGSGTFGETWQICGMDVNGIVDDYAVKILHPEHFNLRLVNRETEGLRRFDSDDIVRLLDVRDVVLVAEKRTVLVCEHVDGGSVGQNLAANGLPTTDQTVSFALGLMSTIDKLHSVDVIHRDIKPDNIILRRGDWARPVLIDFGLSRGLTDETFTVYPARVGTVAYMSPEQLRGEKARKASDIWACGVLFYKLLTGNHPYITATDGLHIDDLADLVVGDPRPMAEGVPSELESLVGRMLSDHEYQRGSARRTLSDLEKLATK